MLKWTKSQKNMILMFTAAILLAVVFSATTIPTMAYLHLYDLHTFMYAGLVISWGFLVHQRIVNPLVRRYLVAASLFMLFLFLCRLIRWRCFKNVAVVLEYSWYAYYVSFIMVPLCALYAAICVGKREEDQPLRYVKWLTGIQALLAGLAFSNSFHELFFRYVDKETGKYEYGIVYYICVGWGAVLTITAFLMIVKKCRVNAARRYWFVPAAGMLLGAMLIVLYYANGSSSPTIFGVKLYNLQEAFCLTIILPFEMMIQLGILPNNSRYDLLFADSDFAAAILDEGGNVVFFSKGELRRTFSDDGEEGQFRRNEKKIHGGSIIWEEDLSVVHRIEKEIQEATEKLEEENGLIRQENEIRAERISYETKNRLYDKIAKAVHDKAVRVDEILSAVQAGSQAGALCPAMVEEKSADGDMQRASCLQQAVVIGAYIKRMGNLMLIAEETPQISTLELGNCIRESLEYFGLTGKMQSFLEKGERALPAKLVLLAYELFEEIMENPQGLSSIIVWMDSRKGFLLRISFDTEANPAREYLTGIPAKGAESRNAADAEKWTGVAFDGWRREELARFGAVVHMERVDDIWRVPLTVNAQSAAEYETSQAESEQPAGKQQAERGDET